LRVKGAQEVLGDWNDVRVLRGYLRSFAKEKGPAKKSLAKLEHICDTEAFAHLGKFTTIAPALLDKHPHADTLKLISSQKVGCCIRRKPVKPEKRSS
jgi:hypothetical protein